MRRTPLGRNTPLRSSSGLRRQSTRRQSEQQQRRRTLAMLAEERGPWCQVQLTNVCTGRWVDGHELLPRSAGGSIVDPDNIVLSCRRCHEVITDNPKWARQAGWSISRYDGNRRREP